MCVCVCVSVDQVEPIVLGVIQEVMEFSLSFLEKSNFTQNDLKMEVCLFYLYNNNCVTRIIYFNL